jgi:hypothetical protein
MYLLDNCYEKNVLFNLQLVHSWTICITQENVGLHLQ